MAGDVAAAAAILIAVFLIGAACGLTVLVAAAVRREDHNTLRRADRSLALRDQAPDFIACGVRRLSGVGLRNGPARL